MKNHKNIQMRKAKTKKQWKAEMKRNRSLAYAGKNTGTIIHDSKKKYDRNVSKSALRSDMNRSDDL